MNTIITLQKDDSIITVDLQGGYVNSWDIAKRSILYRGVDMKRRGIPILFPYFGKPSLDLPQHGFGRDTLWRCVEKEETSMSMFITDTDISIAAQKYYPYRFKATIELALLEPNTLHYILKVENTGAVPLPISPGLHPYWSIEHGAKRDVIIDGLADFDASVVDWDHAPPDTDYAFANPTTFHMDTYSMCMRDESADKNIIKQITIWSQPISSPDHDFICIEPICGIRGRYLTNPVQILPNEEWEMSVGFEAHIK